MNDFAGIDRGEQEIVRTRMHWVVFARDSGFVALICLGPFLAYPFFFANDILLAVTGEYQRLIPALGSLWVLIAWIALAVVWMDYLFNHLVVTDRRIVYIDQSAVFSRTVKTWRLDRIKEVSIGRRGPLQMALNYGSIVIRTVGQFAEPETIADVPDPERVRSAIFQNITSLSTLAAANSDQEKLLRTISHEVKAHLSKNAAALAAIVEGDLGEASEQLKKVAGAALAETRKGVGMVTDLLKASDFKTGTMSFEKKTFDLAAAVKDVVAELTPDAESKKLALEYTAPNNTCLINGDEEKIRDHVIKNLIDNAIHYTQQGSIRVALARVDNVIVLMVADTGIGISENDRARLFTEGGRGEHSAIVNPASTGYGLFIAKSVVHAHGGLIWAQSQGHGAGSQFYACFPVA